VFLRERHKVELYEVALGVLETLSRDFCLGALTNGNADIYKTDAGEYFDFAFLAEDIGAAKPHPDMFEAALAEAGVQAREVIHVGDDPEHDVRGAIDAGMYSIWVNLRDKPWPGGQRADEEINDLLELPEAIRNIAGRA
ncbi:MAG: HAD family hydrolase, partial [Halioglobus sp.]